MRKLELGRHAAGNDGKVVHVVDIDMEPAPVILRFDSEEAARNVLFVLMSSRPIGFRSVVHLIESEDGRPLYEEE